MCNFSDPFGLCATSSGGDTTRVQTRYEHLDEACVKSGDEVKKGDIIAYSGESGTATAPSLHFETRRIHEGAGDAISNSESTPFNPLNCFAVGFCGHLGTPGKVTSGYGGRDAPMPGASTNHQGMDFRARMRTPIRAAADGRVVFTGTITGGGLSVYINHVYTP